MTYTLEETILCLDKVSAGYDDKVIIKDVSLIEKNVVRAGFTATGQTIAVLGRSGRGKSTLFKALTGLLKPFTGHVLISDATTQQPDDAHVVQQGDVGFVDQKYTLFRHKTVNQTFMYALRRSNKSGAEKKQLIQKYLADWGLTEHQNKYPCELSGGQRQRTAIIEQILSSKHFMVFDEPFSGLDVGNIEQVKKSFELIQNADELNTIIFSTHDINLAVELADSIYIIGRPEENAQYSTIVKHYDLKQMGLAWQAYGMQHVNLVKEIKQVLLNS